MILVRDGDVAKLGLLFERHHGKLFNFLVRITDRRDVGEDLVQDVFFRILKYRHTFRGDAPFTAWMYQLGRNAAADHFRKWKEDPVPHEAMESNKSPEPTASDMLEHMEKNSLLHRGVAVTIEEAARHLKMDLKKSTCAIQVSTILNCP